MTGGYVDLEQVRWDLQVATGQTVAGSGVEARMREARAAAGRLAAGLPGLLDELEHLRRLPAELADARAEVERVSAAWADVIQRQQLADNAHRYDVEEITGRAVAAEARLEAVRELADEADALPESRRNYDGSIRPGTVTTEQIRAALSAASPTASNDRETREVVDEYVRLHRPMEPPAAASDEPARCPHGHTEAHVVVSTQANRYAGIPDAAQCPGPAASGTPDTTR